LSGGTTPLPGASMKVEGALTNPLAAASQQANLTLAPDRFFDGNAFDPDDIPGYLQRLDRG
jgi:NitT/TauT family transport system ATP-binding protein